MSLSMNICMYKLTYYFKNSNGELINLLKYPNNFFLILYVWFLEPRAPNIKKLWLLRLCIKTNFITFFYHWIMGSLFRYKISDRVKLSTDHQYNTLTRYIQYPKPRIDLITETIAAVVPCKTNLNDKPCWHLHQDSFNKFEKMVHSLLIYKCQMVLVFTFSNN